MKERTPESNSLHQQHKYLVIDDDNAGRLLLRQVLERQGFNVTLAKNGCEGVLVAQECQPDVILVDIGLPDISGLDVLARLIGLGLTHKSKVIAVTGYATPEDQTKFLSAGFHGCIAKPFDIKTICDTIDKIM